MCPGKVSARPLAPAPDLLGHMALRTVVKLGLMGCVRSLQVLTV